MLFPILFIYHISFIVIVVIVVVVIPVVVVVVVFVVQNDSNWASVGSNSDSDRVFSFCF